MPRYPYIVYPEYFVCRGGGGIASSSLKKNYYYCNPDFQPVVLVFLYSIPGVFCLSGGGDSFLFIKEKTTTTVIRN